MHLTPRRYVAAGVGALVLVGGIAAVAGGASSSGGFRTAVVSTRSVDQELAGVATIEPVDQAAVAFPVAGTVESVSVAVGDTVAVGDELATLDTTELERTLHQEQADLAEAQLNLERALNGESVAVGGDGGEMVPTSSSDTVELATELVAYQAASGPSDADIAAAQQAVVDAQAQADAAASAASAAVANANSVCAAVGSADQAGFPAALTACMDALNAAVAAQQAVTDAQAAVSAAALTLDGLLGARAAALAEQPSTTTTPSAPSGGLEGGSTPSSGLGSTTSGSSVTAEQLIVLQRQLDAAVLEVLAAQQAVDQATVVSPIRGTVAAVNLAEGDEVDAASSTANVVVVGRGGYEATLSVSVDDVADVAVGQAAEVAVDGRAQPLLGEVVAIGVAADDGVYPVTVGLTGDGGDELGNGSTATVTIVTDAADEVLAVPTSAVTVDGEQTSVQVVEGGEATTVDVEIGAVGDTWTEVTGGLAEGEEVVLADLDAPLPSSATATSGSDEGVDQIFGGGGPPVRFTPPG